MYDHYPKHKGWSKLVEQNWYIGTEQIRSVVMNNKESGHMGRFVHGAYECKLANGIAAQAACSAHASFVAAVEAAWKVTWQRAYGLRDAHERKGGGGREMV